MIYKYIYTHEICNSNGYTGRKYGANKNRRKKKRIYRKFAIWKKVTRFCEEVESTNVTIYSYITTNTRTHTCIQT